jgi:hypothetical protein
MTFVIELPVTLIFATPLPALLIVLVEPTADTVAIPVLVDEN